MVKDYARRAEQQSRHLRPWQQGLIALGVLLIMILLALVFFHHPHATKPQKQPTQEKPKQVKLPDKAVTTPSKPTPKPKATNDPQFDFYTLLPNMKVSIPKQTPVAITHTQYLLQFSSVKSYDSAKQLTDKLGAIGVDASIQQYPIAGDTWYRVISGPYPSEQAATQIQTQLRLQNIDSLLIKLSPKKDNTSSTDRAK